MIRALSKVLVGVVLATGLMACGGEPEVASSGNDIVDGDEASRFAFAALVDAQLDIGVGECSGAVIAPRVVLTAGHCVYGFGSWVVTTPYALNDNGEPQTAKALSGEAFDWAAEHDAPNPEQHDVGLLYLDRDIVLDSYPELASDGDAEGEEVRYVGRVGDGDVSSSGLFVGHAVRTRDGASVGWPYTFATSKYSEQGDSGGPVVLADDEHHIVGVDSGGNWELDVQLLARVDLLHDWIAERIAAHAE